MRIRWIIAGVGAVALAAVTVSSLWWTHDTEMVAEACATDAKTANLNYSLKDLEDRDVSLADYRGKVILLDFWATWCGPCKVEIPEFIEFQKTYGKDGFQVIGISVDDTLEALKPYAAEMQMNYPVLRALGRDDVLDDFGPILGLPTTMLISREGKICETHAGLTSKETFERGIKALL
jgi:thiol-disulfide isomerase/thioredoxin